MPWLVRNAEVLASVELATDRAGRRRGLIGRDGLDGVLVLRARSVHTFGVRFPIDVAFCCPQTAGGGPGDATGGGGGAEPWRLRVVRVVTVHGRRITRPSLRGSVAIEAPAGSFRRWGVVPGDVLEVR